VTRTAPVLALLLLATSAAAQSPPDDSARAKPRSWAGEHLHYKASIGILPIGGAELLVAGIDTIQGTDALHIRFILDGSALMYQVHDESDSWVALSDFTSRRFVQDYNEGGHHRHNDYEIYPDSGFYRQREEGVDSTITLPTSPQPLDDAAFFYFVRTVPLVVGERYEFNRYFKPDRNPVVLEVVGRDTLDVPAGRFDCLVVRPIIKGGGIFREGAKGQLWISNDERRVVVQIKSRIGPLSITMRLAEITSPDDQPDTGRP
jgi:Protein of unknown function (DUF3108)